MNVNVIPAEPGFFVLEVDDDTGELVKDEPVLAWECRTESDEHIETGQKVYHTRASPITLGEGTLENGRIEYVLYPDGRVLMMDTGVFDNMTEANFHVNCNIRLCGDPQEQFRGEG